MICRLFALLLFCFPNINLVAQDDGSKLDSIKENLWSKIDVQLNYWDVFVEFEGQQKQRIRESMADSVHNLATASLGAERVYFRQLPTDVLNTLKENLTKIAGVNALQKVEDDDELIRKFNREMAIASVATRLDLGLALSADQISSLTKCFTETWDSSEYEYASPAYSQSMPGHGLPDEAIKQILSPDQYSYWLENRDSTTSADKMTFYYAADDAERVSRFEPILDAAIALRVSVIRQRYRLDDSQIRKLNLLVKRHREKLVELKTQAYRDVEMVRDMGRPPTDSPLSGRATMTAAALLGSEGSWTEFVRKTLKGDDKIAFQELTEIRNELHHSANIYNLVRVYKRWAGMNGQQMFELYEVCKANIPIDANLTRGDREMYFAVNDLPEPGIEGILTQKQMKRVEFWTNNMQKLHELIAAEREKLNQ